jgi:DnaJ-class molecular chaperone
MRAHEPEKDDTRVDGQPVSDGRPTAASNEPTQTMCQNCIGRGWIFFGYPHYDSEPCGRCGGSGYISASSQEASGG